MAWKILEQQKAKHAINRNVKTTVFKGLKMHFPINMQLFTHIS